eukprot:TRINITY_DN3280_c0_g6_i2.p2 TRINITY_DN3280_c0_g6~~TRINITY_DN3280_c0_g6_i2.p2  ORF type:complete len:141 (-),score=44.38 TRINITY_DN3280_c0_g6_i2:244-666(-)
MKVLVWTQIFHILVGVLLRWRWRWRRRRRGSLARLGDDGDFNVVAAVVAGGVGVVDVGGVRTVVVAVAVGGTGTFAYVCVGVVRGEWVGVTGFVVFGGIKGAATRGGVIVAVVVVVVVVIVGDGVDVGVRENEVGGGEGE